MMGGRGGIQGGPGSPTPQRNLPHGVGLPRPVGPSWPRERRRRGRRLGVPPRGSRPRVSRGTPRGCWPAHRAGPGPESDPVGVPRARRLGRGRSRPDCVSARAALRAVGRLEQSPALRKRHFEHELARFTDASQQFPPPAPPSELRQSEVATAGGSSTFGCAHVGMSWS